MPGHVFISYHSADRTVAHRLTADLERRGVSVWRGERSILPGTNWGDAVVQAIADSKAMVVLVSQESARSQSVHHEYRLAYEQSLAGRRQIQLLPVIVSDDLDPSDLPAPLTFFEAIRFTGDYEKLTDRLIDALPASILASPAAVAGLRAEAPRAAKGYIFLSYVHADRSFVERLQAVLERRSYAYWDYNVSERDYHGPLYRELEERIENAAAFISLVSDHWRDSQWMAREYLYATEAKVPVFVVQCTTLTSPFPILLIDQTRIDMASDFHRGAKVLERELDSKGL